MATWTLETLKEYFETKIESRDVALRIALNASQTAVDKAEQHLKEILEGFPQEYARRIEIENLETQINLVKSDHVQRREFIDLKDQQSQGRGARLALAATLGIMIALISVALGAMYQNQLTNEDVSNQISREAPWLQDKPLVEKRLQVLEQQVVLLKTELATHEATDKLRFSQRK